MTAYVPQILIVDDEPHICESLRVLLLRQGYAITTAGSGKEAVQMMAGREFDLLLLDMIMPDMSGYQILDYIASSPRDMLTIVITGNASIDSAVAALRKGAYDYLKKPFEYEELLKRVGNALHHKKLSVEKKIIDGKLARAEERYQYLVQHSPDIIYILDAHGVFTFVNGTVERLLGFRPDALCGQPFTAIVHDDDVERASRCCAHVHREQQRMEMKFRVRGAGDRYRIFAVTHTPIEAPGADDPEKIRGTYGVARDITERKQLEDQLAQAKKMEALGALAGGIAHDFNNVLMGIMGYTSLMLAELDRAHPQYAKLQSIEQHVRSGAALARQLLNFARGRTGEVLPVNLNELLDKTSQMFSRTKRELVVQRRFDPELAAAAVDPGQMEQVFLNLFLNAWQAMPGGGRLTIATENRILDHADAEAVGLLSGRYVAVTVSDTGVGMDEEVMQHIFEPFFTTKESERGTGLGLASVYGIIKNHNGTIRVASRKGAGTTFTILLPATDLPAVCEETTPYSILPGTETVLLVDDEQTMLDVGVEILEAIGYTALSARSGAEALERYADPDKPIDAVIVDLIMPEMNGEELCREIRRRNPAAKILLSSGYSIEGETATALSSICNGFLQKPFALTDLSRKLREILDGPPSLSAS